MIAVWVASGAGERGVCDVCHRTAFAGGRECLRHERIRRCENDSGDECIGRGFVGRAGPNSAQFACQRLCIRIAAPGIGMDGAALRDGNDFVPRRHGMIEVGQVAVAEASLPVFFTIWRSVSS
jgi:hypothetical protein